MSIDLETMLSDSRNIRVQGAADRYNVVQTADKSATLFDFIKLVNRLVALTLKDLNVSFEPDEGKDVIISPGIPMEHNYITYKVLKRSPKDELKPRQRQQIKTLDEDSGEDRVGQVWGQKFMCSVQFNIYASRYEDAEAIEERFEDMMTMYAGYIKKNGVAELYFKEQLTDDSYNMFREQISVRNVRYYVEIEKLTVIFIEKIKEIETLLNQEEE